MDGINSNELIEFGLPLYVAFLLSTVCHECAHAWTANRYGDATASKYISLNPIPHIRRSPFGMVILPFIVLYISGFQYMFGFASVPINVFWAMRNPRKNGLVSLAGPLANLLLALVGVLILTGLFFLFKFLQSSEAAVLISQKLAFFAHILISLNVLLAFFNLMPIPPLDGASVPLIFLPEKSLNSYQEFIFNSKMHLTGIMLASFFFPHIAGKYVYPFSDFLENTSLWFVKLFI